MSMDFYLLNKAHCYLDVPGMWAFQYPCNGLSKLTEFNKHTTITLHAKIIFNTIKVLQRILQTLTQGTGDYLAMTKKSYLLPCLKCPISIRVIREHISYPTLAANVSKHDYSFEKATGYNLTCVESRPWNITPLHTT